MKSAGVYSITNTVNGKTYIGSTQDFEVRWKDHRKGMERGTHWNSHLQNAWDKYGKDAFEFGILEYLDDLDNLVKAEQFWMDIYREEGKTLYNYGLAADNPFRGCKHTKESRDSMSRSHTGKKRGPMTEEHKRKIGDANRGRKPPPMSEETRRKISKSNKGKKRSEEFKRKMSDIQRNMSPEARMKRSCKLSRAAKNQHARAKLTKIRGEI